MKELRGISVSPGIAIGKAYLYVNERPQIPIYDIGPADVPDEMVRFHTARKRASEEVQSLKARSSKDSASSDNGFLDAHLLMLDDPDFIGQVETQLGKQYKNVEWVVHHVIEIHVKDLLKSDGLYLRDRAVDIYDVGNRLLNHLLCRQNTSLANLSEEIVLVTHDLLPSEAVLMNRTLVRGIAMDAGGKTSHTAILARSFEIVAVLGLSDITLNVENGEEIIVDGNTGVVVVNPDRATKVKYRGTSRAWLKSEVSLRTLNDMPAETTDGKRISLQANVGVPEETASALAHGAEGIGLYRSEFLFLEPGSLPGEQEQFEAYRRVLDALPGKPVTIRTLDLGADKIAPNLEDYDEKNPILGWRAVRFCLSRPDIFKTQLKAILRASAFGDLKVMFPMISGLEELKAAHSIFDEVKGECRSAGVPFNEEIETGSMIEIPAAAMTTDILAHHASFFSIGTNDLIQYMIAVDRGNERVAYLYEPFHPGVLRMIRLVIQNAHAAGIPVCMCGEMAGDPLATVILLGLGLDALSMSSFSIPRVKQIIRSVSLSDAQAATAQVMEMSSHREIEDFVRVWMHERFDVVLT